MTTPALTQWLLTKKRPALVGPRNLNSTEVKPIPTVFRLLSGNQSRGARTGITSTDKQVSDWLT